ncbi:MAG: hypothetical protein QN174_09715 [Armatimonadota bacterium]|nr:hypothetical protein [Armatimonadota bacterium]MDR7422787.1 hypothetical protein [Armatimonadota bacterium]MDR7453353.1 hypothetical protein [Armatimonadota bacterium]MDR7457039.1 hypothetical protein [Armatimonadota bacterium]MDR7497221.1 hypothetical protein [Armatimonadota bacterium]
MSDRSRYAPGVVVLSAVGLACALVIVISEILGSPERRVYWQIGGAALGTIFIVYGLLLLLLRKMGMIGPRRAER